MISIRNLSIDLDEFHLKDISLDIEAGEYMVLLGPTGAGKTVLVECVVGIQEPKSGRIFIDEEDVTPLYPEERHVGYVPQDYALFPNLTVRENLEYGLDAKDVEPGEKKGLVDSMMEELGIDSLHYRYPLHLSGGERQRVALGRSLITDPRILLLDEPLSALDENLRAELAQQLRRVQKARGGTFLHVCHNFEEAAELADRVAIMNEGRVVQVASISEILEKPKNLFVARFSRCRNFYSAQSKGRGDEGSDLTLPGGKRLESSYASVSGALTVAIRPEDVQIQGHCLSREVPAANSEKAKTPGDVNRIFVEVERVKEKLTHSELHCRGEIDMVVYLRSGNGRAWESAKLELFIPPDKVKLFPC